MPTRFPHAVCTMLMAAALAGLSPARSAERVDLSGTVVGEDGVGLAECRVRLTVAGLWAFTDTTGAFTLSGLPATSSVAGPEAEELPAFVAGYPDRFERQLGGVEAAGVFQNGRIALAADLFQDLADRFHVPGPEVDAPVDDAGQPPARGFARIVEDLHAFSSRQAATGNGIRWPGVAAGPGGPRTRPTAGPRH